MAKTEQTFTDQELDLLQQALTQLIASTKRAQNTSKSPQIKEVYRLHEMTLRSLDAKCMAMRS